MKMFRVSVNQLPTMDLNCVEIKNVLEIYLDPLELKPGHYYKINIELLREFANDKFVKQFPDRKKLSAEIMDAESKGMTHIIYYCSE